MTWASFEITRYDFYEYVKFGNGETYHQRKAANKADHSLCAVTSQ